MLEKLKEYLKKDQIQEHYAGIWSMGGSQFTKDEFKEDLKGTYEDELLTLCEVAGEMEGIFDDIFAKSERIFQHFAPAGQWPHYGKGSDIQKVAEIFEILVK